MYASVYSLWQEVCSFAWNMIQGLGPHQVYSCTLRLWRSRGGVGTNVKSKWFPFIFLLELGNNWFHLQKWFLRKKLSLIWSTFLIYQAPSRQEFPWFLRFFHEFKGTFSVYHKQKKNTKNVFAGIYRNFSQYFGLKDKYSSGAKMKFFWKIRFDGLLDLEYVYAKYTPCKH